MQPLQQGSTGPLPTLQQFQPPHPTPHLPSASAVVLPGQPTHPVQLTAHDSMYPAHIGHPLQQQQQQQQQAHLPPLAPQQQHHPSSRPGSSSGAPPLLAHGSAQHMQPPQHLMNYASGSGTPLGGGGGGGAGAGAGSGSAAPAKKGTKRGAPDSNGKDKEKKTRSKAACSQCKAVKQKCEGPPYVPCRRCELYKLECKFPPGTKTVPRPVEAAASGPAAAGGEPSSAVTAKLYEIATRLQTIESALHIASAPSPALQSSDTHSHPPRSPSAHSSDDGQDADDDGDGSTAGKAAAATANPIGEINATVDSLAGFKSGPRQSIMEMNDYGAPDVLRRGVLTPVECQQLFDFFFASLHPWIMMLSLDDDRDAMAVRDKSPLLFHTILLLSTAYSTPFPSQLHLTLVTFLNNILAPQLLNPQPHELTTDFLRALDLLNIYKPVQFGARRAEGHDDTEAMRVSKVNGLASWMLQGILARTAERLELKETVSKFARAYSASASGAPVPKELLRDLRLYYWLLSNDVHGNVQSGRRCNMEGSQALTTTRLFSSLQLQPFDVRLAASVEMFEVARPILRSYSYERTRRIPKPDLERYNAGMRSFDETWIPVLLRQLAVDPLAMTVISPFREFITLQFNATCYVSYKSTRLYASSSDGGGSGSGNEGGGGGGGRPTSSGGPEGRAKRLRTEGPRGLNDWEYDGLAKCVRSAEFLVFSLSEESRVPGAWRVVQWEEAERADGWRKLILDDQMVEQSRWGMDAITCVAYIFPLVFLSKLVNEGLLTTNLTLLRTPASQPAWHYTQKLPRLLELGAAFLDAVGTSPHHPSRAQAHVVRTLLETGIKGRLPTPLTGPRALGPSLGLLDGGGLDAPSPGGTGPSHAATVMSPSPQSLPQPLAPVDQGQPGYPQGGIPYPPVQQQQQQQGGGLPFPATTGADGRPNWAPPSFTPASTGAGAGIGQSMYTASTRAGGQAPPEHSPGAAYPPPPVMIPGMDDALGSVLNDFEPLFGETDGGFWEWAGLSGGNNLVQPQP